MNSKTRKKNSEPLPIEKKPSCKTEITSVVYDPATVATIAAVLSQGRVDVPSGEAVRRAVELLDESRRALADHVKQDEPVPPRLPYNDGVAFITGIKGRLSRAVESLEKLMTKTPNLLEDWRERFLKHLEDYTISEVGPSGITADVLLRPMNWEYFLTAKKTNGFDREELIFLRSQHEANKGKRGKKIM